MFVLNEDEFEPNQQLDTLCSGIVWRRHMLNMV